MIEMRNRWKRRLAVVADRLLPLTAGVSRRRGVVGPGPVSVERGMKMLVIRCDHIGDAVMAMPALAALRADLAPARIDVLAGPWAAALFEQHPAVDRVIAYAAPWWAAVRGASFRERTRAWLTLPGLVRRIRAERYDVGIDLRGDLRQIYFFLALAGIPERVSTDRTGGASLLTRTWRYDPTLHEVEQNMAVVGRLGVRAEVASARVPCTPLGADVKRALASVAGPAGFVVLALRGNAPNKSWPVEHAAVLIDELRERWDLGAVYVGGTADHPTGEAIRAASAAPVLNLAGHTTLGETVALFARATAAIAVDSGPMHMAAATGTPVIALFGPTDPVRYRPWSARARVVAVTAPCGCRHSGCDRSGRSAAECMTNIRPDLVLGALRDLLAVAPDSPELQTRGLTRERDRA